MVFSVINPAMDIMLVSVGAQLLLKFMQKKTGVTAKMDSRKKEMNEKKDKMKELTKKDDQKSVEELNKLRSEMLQDSTKALQDGMKPMMYSLVVIMPIIFLLGGIYGETLINTPFAIPFIAPLGECTWIWWYIFVSISFSIVFAIAGKVYKKVRENDQAK